MAVAPGTTAGLGRRPIPVLTLVALFVASRVVYWSMGVRFDATQLSGTSPSDLYQLLDVRLLRDQLVTSLLNLHSQPPLFNLYCGLILHLPSEVQVPTLWVSYMALGLVMVVATFLLLRELRVPSWLAFLVAAFITVSPTYVLYENWLFYAYPTAAFVTLSGLFCVRFFRSHRRRDGLAFFAAVTVLALTNSTYQVVWVIAVVALTSVLLRGEWRRTLVVCLLPLLLVVAWVVHDEVAFGTSTTSSWLGMNLYKTTLQPARLRGELTALVRHGTLDRFALVQPWKPVTYYVAHGVTVTRTGVAALDQRTKSDGWPNYNNEIYLTVSSHLLNDDLRYIEARPSEYLGNVSRGVSLWFVPADQYPFFYANWLKIQGFADSVDHVVGWQARIGPAETFPSEARALRYPSASQISWGTVLIFGLAVVGTPVVLWRRRRRRGGQRSAVSTGALLYLWGTVCYAFVTTSLSDVGENNRFRFELGPVPVVLAVAVAVAVVRSIGVDRRTLAPVRPARTRRPLDLASITPASAGTGSPVGLDAL